jgi:hypothetical protein
MSVITGDLRTEVENLDLVPYFDERICRINISKNWDGLFKLERSDTQECRDPQCVTAKNMIQFESSRIQRNQPCDSVNAGGLDGIIGGNIVFSYIDNGLRRGYHKGKFEWTGGASKLIGQMTGVTNAGTHRPPFMQCEQCEERGHMEGCLKAVVIEGQHTGCRVVATYVLLFDAGADPHGSGFRGAIEGVLICDCRG